MDLFILLSAAFSTSFLVVLITIPALIYIAFKFNILDAPDGKIKLHKKPVPYLGGVGIHLGVWLTYLFFYGFNINDAVFATLWGLSTLLLILGLVDDVMCLKPHTKLIGQVVSVVIFYYIFYRFTNAVHLGSYNFNLLELMEKLYGFVWLLTIINAFNLIDVMDGLASVTAIGVSIILLIYTIKFQFMNGAFLLVCLLGALAAFLIYNRPPAKIYLGDAGSMFLGGFLAGLSIFIFSGQPNYAIKYIVPNIIFIVPLYELIALIVIRFYKGIPFYNGSPDHFSMYLQHYGLTKQQILLLIAAFYLGLASIFCIFSI